MAPRCDGCRGELRNVPISAAGGRRTASIQTEREVPQPVPVATTALGIHVGIALFAMLRDGTFLEPPISKHHAMVCIEDLQVRHMSASAAGTADEPGRNVRAKAGLNKAILDQGWAEFRRQLDYKLAWAGGQLVAVPPRNTSRSCPACGHVARENRKTQARFACVACGLEEHADLQRSKGGTRPDSRWRYFVCWRRASYLEMRPGCAPPAELLGGRQPDRRRVARTRC